MSPHPCGVRGTLGSRDRGYRSLCSLNPRLNSLHRFAVRQIRKHVPAPIFPPSILLDSHVPEKTLASPITRYVRYLTHGKACYGVLDGQTIHELKGDFLHDVTPTGNALRAGDV